MTSNSGTVRMGMGFVWRVVRRYRVESALSTAAALLWMAMVIVGPYLSKRVVDDAIVGNDQSLLWPLLLIVLVAGAARALGIGGRRYFAFRLAYRAETDIRNRIFEHVQRLAFAFHDRTSTGELMARASTDLSQFRIVLAMLPITVANIALLLAVACVLVVLDPLLGAVTALAIPTLLFTARHYAGRVLAVSFDVQQSLADLSSDVEEAVSGVRVVKSYGQEEREVARVAATSDRIYDRTIELIRHRATYVPIFEALPAIASGIILLIGGLRVIDDTMTLGDFVAFTEYLVILNFPLRMTGWFFAEVPRASASAVRIGDLLATAPEITDPLKPTRLPAGRGEVRFEGVSFAYPDGQTVLDGIDLRVAAGASIALVGATGSGKSTVAKLIPRFYDVTSGRILLDGVDVTTVALDELRTAVAVAFEEPFLFSSSVRGNIAFGAPDATDEQVRLAARLARADEFIAELPDGYDTVVGERGFSLSGGQRQRIALARSVLRDPRVLILDDAMSSVDAATEHEIRDALATVMAGRTTIIIAHRPATLALADQVVFLDDGAVAAVGDHRHLLATVPRYAEVLAEVYGDPSGKAV